MSESHIQVTFPAFFMFFYKENSKDLLQVPVSTLPQHSILIPPDPNSAPMKRQTERSRVGAETELKLNRPGSVQGGPKNSRKKRGKMRRKRN